MADRPIVLVTGGSRGIGAAIVGLAGEKGFDVAINYKQSAKAAEDLVAAVEKSGGRAIAVQGDMAREADVARVFETVDKSLGRIDHLVYNSGIAGNMSRVEAMQTAWMQECFAVNVFGAFYAVRAAVPRMSVKQGGKGGSIVLLSSVAATLGSPGVYVWYAASKGAIDTMTKGLSIELAEDGIRVNAVTPGLIDTGVNSPERIAQLMPTVPLRRMGSPRELAQNVVFLISDAASYVTGANLRVGGGR